jgi:hypothetical protein
MNDDAVSLQNRIVSIAGKRAPTEFAPLSSQQQIKR